MYKRKKSTEIICDFDPRPRTTVKNHPTMMINLFSTSESTFIETRKLRNRFTDSFSFLPFLARCCMYFLFGKIRTNSKFIDLALAHDSKSQARFTRKSTPSPSTARYQRTALISKHHKLIRFSRNFQFFSNGISIDRSRPDIHLVFIFHTHENVALFFRRQIRSIRTRSSANEQSHDNANNFNYTFN